MDVSEGRSESDPGKDHCGRLCRSNRPGHHQHALHDFRPFGCRGGPPPTRTRADPAEGRVGRAQSRGDLGTHGRGDHDRAQQDQPEPRRSRGPRHHQSARDVAGVEPAYRTAVPQRDRLAGHAHRPDRGRAGPRRAGPDHPAQGRAAARHLLLWRQAAVDPGERRRRARRRREGRRDLRYRRQLGGLAADRGDARRCPCHRCHQRQPHHADEPGDPRLGR